MIKKRGRGVLIISISFSPNVGGVETHLDDLCRYLCKKDYRVFVITYQPITTKIKGLRMEKKDNLEIRRINWFGHNWFHKLESFPLFEFFYLFPGLCIGTFCFMMKNHYKIDIIHAHGLIAGAVTRFLTLFYKKKIKVLSIHAIYGFKKRKILSLISKWIFIGFDKILPLAKISEKDISSVKLPEGKIKSYSQWVDQNLFKPREKEKCRCLLELKGNFFVAFVGRLIEKKGIKLLLKVAESLSYIKFIFIGDGPLTNIIKEASKRLGNVYLTGRKNQHELAIYYGAVDLVAVPSQYEEGFARVVMEALSSGRPVIASNKGCLPEMVSSEVGILVEPTVDNFKKEIESLYFNRERLKKLTHNARTYAEKHFSERNALEIIKAYSLL